MLLLLILPLNARASLDTALSMVPKGKILEILGRDFIIKTPAGTKIGIEFHRSGKLEEAKGRNLNQGDDLEPGDGLISLSSAARHLHSKGIKPKGYWALENDKDLGWVYEFEMAIVSAKTGKLIKRITAEVESH